MKLKALFQAALILLFLGVSWIILILRNQEDPKPDGADPSSIEVGEISAEDSPVSSLKSAPSRVAPQIPDRDLVTGNWHEWWDYLEAQESPMAMRSALAQLRDLVQDMDPDWAIAWIMEFLESGADMKTGLAFQLQGEGRLRGAASLRAILLDMLQMLDPDLAGEIARKELTEEGTGLTPDVYVIHLRNYARTPTLSKTESIPFLQDKFEDLIQYQPWMDHPNAALAEAMDVVVYTRSTQFVPELTDLMEKNQKQMLRHASSLALERLVDIAPLETLDSLLKTLPEHPDLANARAGYFARLDPGIPGGPELLEAYLHSPALRRDEAIRFLESFPNLNQSLSYNLLSTEISITPPGGYVDRIRNAVDQVEKWQENQNLKHLEDILAQTRSRLLVQLTGEPIP